MDRYGLGGPHDAMASRAVRSIRVGWEHLLLGGILTLASAAPSAAHGYSTGAFVPSKQNECVGVPASQWGNG